ncbi:MAG: beta-galactosidase trimerization domain-containing protein, partial [candidate division FCPU426 bacterium]
KVEAYDVQEIERYRTRPGDAALSLQLEKALGGGKAAAHSWYDLLSLQGAESLARYGQEFFKGTPAITRHRYGKGWAIYVGCAGDPGLYDKVFRMAAALAGLKPLMKVPKGVEVRERTTQQGTLRFILNYTRSKKLVSPGFGYRDAFSGLAVKPSFTLEPYGVAVLEKSKG